MDWDREGLIDWAATLLYATRLDESTWWFECRVRRQWFAVTSDALFVLASMVYSQEDPDSDIDPVSYRSWVGDYVWSAQ